MIAKKAKANKPKMIMLLVFSLLQFFHLAFQVRLLDAFHLLVHRFHGINQLIDQLVFFLEIRINANDFRRMIAKRFPTAVFELIWFFVKEVFTRLYD